MNLEVDDLARLAEVLHTAVLCDVLDRHGLRHQALRPFVRPLDDGTRLFGRARTGRFEPRDGVLDGEHPYDVEIALIDDLHVGDVVVFACDGPTETVAPWGELLTTAARMHGAVGVVTDGLVRDVRTIKRSGFPTFAGGIGPLDSQGRAKMTQRDVPVTCAGVPVAPQDLLFADVDGVVVIPQSIAASVIGAALAKLEGENVTRREIEQGSLLADIYLRHGVL